MGFLQVCNVRLMPKSAHRIHPTEASASSSPKPVQLLDQMNCRNSDWYSTSLNNVKSWEINYTNQNRVKSCQITIIPIRTIKTWRLWMNQRPFPGGWQAPFAGLQKTRICCQDPWSICIWAGKLDKFFIFLLYFLLESSVIIWFITWGDSNYPSAPVCGILCDLVVLAPNQQQFQRCEWYTHLEALAAHVVESDLKLRNSLEFTVKMTKSKIVRCEMFDDRPVWKLGRRFLKELLFCFTATDTFDIAELPPSSRKSCAAGFCKMQCDSWDLYQHLWLGVLWRSLLEQIDLRSIFHIFHQCQVMQFEDSTLRGVETTNLGQEHCWQCHNLWQRIEVGTAVELISGWLWLGIELHNWNLWLLAWDKSCIEIIDLVEAPKFCWDVMFLLAEIWAQKWRVEDFKIQLGKSLITPGDVQTAASQLRLVLVSAAPVRGRRSWHEDAVLHRSLASSFVAG